jgi:hypothetical protein
VQPLTTRGFPDDTQRLSTDDAPMHVFVVERFLVGWSTDEVDELIERCARCAPAFARIGVRHLESIVIPGDETCLSVFTGPDADTVLEANVDLDLPAGRVLPAVTHREG